jgi:hypothetical protein
MEPSSSPPISSSPASTVSPALKALLHGFIDYAGLFPPAAVSLDEAVKNYQTYQQSPFAWMLNWLVVPEAKAAAVPADLQASLSILAENDKAGAAIESKTIIQSSKPVYCEILPGDAGSLDRAKEAGCFAKIRTGGIVAEAFPSPAQVATFINDCADRRLAFKATAGLHHPIRSMRPLTYENNAPQAVMHGFVNLLMAAAFSYHGDSEIEAVLAEEDPAAFRFDDGAHWRDKPLSLAHIEEARLNFIHSVGSCSFDEPVNDLREIGYL